jgi:hypothetical protein
MVIPTSQAMSAAVLALAVMWLRLAAPATRPSVPGRFTAIVATCLCATALVVLAALPASDFGQMTRREQSWQADHPGAMMWPRFWQQGWIGPDNDPSARGEARLPKELR